MRRDFRVRKWVMEPLEDRRLLAIDLGESQFNQQIGLQSDNSVVVLDHGNVLTRFDALDQPDLSFGSNGTLVVGGPPTIATRLAIDAFDRVVVAADNHPAGSINVFRYHANGAPDESFGQAGVSVLDEFVFYEHLEGVLSFPDGSLLVRLTGQDRSVDAQEEVLIRLTATGMVDASFGIDGAIRETSLEEFGEIVIFRDGIVVGLLEEGRDTLLTVRRFTLGGQADVSFGDDGQAELPLAGYTWGVQGLAVQKDGGVILAAVVDFQDVAVYRLTSTGEWDESFGFQGKITYPVGIEYAVVAGIDVQQNGKIVVGMYSRYPNWQWSYQWSDNWTYVARFLPNGQPDWTFGLAHAGDESMPAQRFDGLLLESGLTSDGSIVLSQKLRTGGPPEQVLYNRGWVRRLEGDPLSYPPTDIALSSPIVPENSANGLVIGTLLAVDPDAGETFTYSLLNTAGGRFRIEGDQVLVDNGSLLNFETAQSHLIRVKVTDAGGLAFVKDLDVTVADLNEPPVGLNLSASVVPENSAAGTVVGELLASDPDQVPAGLVLLYNPVDGTARLKNFGPTEIRTDAYQIDSTSGKLDPVGWQTVDEWVALPNGASEALLVLGPGENTVVSGWDEAGPSSFFLSEINVADEAVLSPGESWPIGLPFTAFDTADLEFSYRDVGPTSGVVKVGQVLFDYPDGLAFSLVDSAGGRFQIVGNELQVAPGASLDYESKQSHTVRVKVTDAGGATVEQDFVVTLTNLNEAPVVTVPGQQLTTPGAVLPLTGLKLADPDLLGVDPDTKPLRLSLTADHGIVQLGSLAGLTVVSGANSSPSAVLEGSLTALNAAVATLAHKADQAFHGLATLSVGLDDLGHLGEGAPLSDVESVDIRVNNPPVAVADTYQIGFGRTLRANSYQQAVLDSGPLAYWRLGDSGPVVEDSAEDYDGETSVATVLGVSGALAGDPNKAAGFEALNSRVVVDGAEALAQPAGAFSVEAWVNPSQSLAWQRIASTRNGPNAGWGFALSNGRLAFTTYGIQDYFVEGHPVPLNQWSHVAVVFDANHDASFFLNGSFVGKVDGTAHPNPGGSLLAIGDNPDQSAQPFLGKLDEVAFYAKPLSGDEVSRHYQAGLLNATVLVNDSDADGDPLHAVLVAQPQHGQLTFAADGSFTYKPNAGFYGQDKFTYQATDAYFASLPVEVTINVIPVPGDADLDGDVDLADFGVLKENFGKSGMSREQGDFNGDGTVDLADFGILKDAFGTVEPGDE